MEKDFNDLTKCPFHNRMMGQKVSGEGIKNTDWWPGVPKIDVLRQYSPLANPTGKDYGHAKAFLSLDLKAVKNDLRHLITDSQYWWPPDFGQY